MTTLEQKQKEYIKYLLDVRCPLFKTELQKLFESEIAELEKQSITDADIEAWAEQRTYDGNIKYDLIQGAKAMLNGEIKHKT